MKEKQTKIINIRECLLRFSENPDKSSVEALMDACYDDKNWSGFIDFSDEILTVTDALFTVCLEAFCNDRTDILDAVFNVLKANGFINNYSAEPVRRMVPHIKAAIMTHTHTETLMHILVPDNALSYYLNEGMFHTAVFSDNYIIAQRLQEIQSFDVDAEMLQMLIDNNKYEQLDILLGNGKYIRQSGVIGSILCEAAKSVNPDVLLKQIRFLAERYAPHFCGSEREEREFIAQNSDIDKTTGTIYQSVTDGKGAEATIDYLIRTGIKLSEAGEVFAKCALSIGSAEDKRYDFITDSLAKLMDENTYICYENIMTYHIEVDGDNWHEKMKLLIKDVSKKLPQPVILDICREPVTFFTAKNIALLKHLLKCCRVKPIDNLAADSLINHAILSDKSSLIDAILKTGTVAPHVVEEMVSMCIECKRYRCLNAINKYCIKERQMTDTNIT